MVTLLRLNRCQYLLWKNREWGNVGRERERETEGHTQRDTDTEKDTEREGINPQIYKRKDGTKRVRFIREESKDS